MPDPAAQAALAALVVRGRAALPADAVRHDWRSRAQWHLTLRFLGESIDDDRRTRVAAAMADLAMATAAADAAVGGTGYWPEARVLVARIEGGKALHALLESVEAAVRGCGFPSGRAKTPHITLARLRGHPPSTAPAQEMEPVPFRIDRVQLLHTVPGAYAPQAVWPLASAAGIA